MVVVLSILAPAFSTFITATVLPTAITEIGKVSTIRGGDDVWSSAFVVSRLQAAGLDVATVRDNTTQAASTCEWRK